MKKQIVLTGLIMTLSLSVFAGLPDGDAQISSGTNDSRIVITTKSRLAGAIGSVVWRGKEFINTFDHGRELQSAASFDDTRAVGAETYNPTEAGSRDDFTGPHSTSRLLRITACGNRLRTRTQMAFWLAPGERSSGTLARNTNALSNCILTKDVTIGVRRWPQALSYHVTFSVPLHTHYVSAQYESVTGYMPPEFDHFWVFDAKTGTLQPLSHGHSPVHDSIVLATADGRYAMGIFAPPQKQRDTVGPIYGRWYFDKARVAKWTCVFRVANSHGIRTGKYKYWMLIPIGTLDQVTDMLRDWHQLNLW
jgi:hypothetical protein